MLLDELMIEVQQKPLNHEASEVALEHIAQHWKGERTQGELGALRATEDSSPKLAYMYP